MDSFHEVVIYIPDIVNIEVFEVVFECFEQVNFLSHNDVYILGDFNASKFAN